MRNPFFTAKTQRTQRKTGKKAMSGSKGGITRDQEGRAPVLNQTVCWFCISSRSLRLCGENVSVVDVIDGEGI